MDNKGYPHPQPGMAMPMPPTYEQSAYPPPLPQQGGMYPPMPMPPPPGQTHHIHYVPPPQPAPIVQEPTVIITPQVGPDPQMITCPSCRETVVSRMEYEATTRTHVSAALCCLFLCWPCAWLPYCMDSCRNGNHYCPSCGAFLGTYRP